MGSKARDITGIVAVACARHGCVAPGSIANLQKGEQQKNVNFSFLSALKTTNVEGIPRVVLLYDIACQYWIHFFDRVGKDLPGDIEYDRGIGIFHVYGHKRTCLWNYGPTFIPGIGVVSGEIVESLWAPLNQVSPSTRSATLPSREETLDDHLSDSNWRKITGTGVLFPTFLWCFLTNITF